MLTNQRDKVLQSLTSLRPKEDADKIPKQIAAIEASILESGGHTSVPWANLLKGNMLRRTWIACSLFVCMQFSGVQFINRYLNSKKGMVIEYTNII